MDNIQFTSYMFPLGFIISVENKNFDPNIFYSNGTWERIKGKVIVGVDENDTDFNTSGKSGGSKYLQRHSHSNAGFPLGGSYPPWSAPHLRVGYIYSADNPYPSNVVSSNEGDGNSGNLQPYITAYMWQLKSYK